MRLSARARDGRYQGLDVKPRIGGTFRLFVGQNGMDVARALYLDLTGQPVPVSDLIEGRKWMDERDVSSCLQYRRDHRLTFRQWATSLRGVQETIYVARDDLAPLRKVTSYALGRLLGRALGRARASIPGGAIDGLGAAAIIVGFRGSSTDRGLDPGRAPGTIAAPDARGERWAQRRALRADWPPDCRSRCVAEPAAAPLRGADRRRSASKSRRVRCAGRSRSRQTETPGHHR